MVVERNIDSIRTVISELEMLFSIRWVTSERPVREAIAKILNGCSSEIIKIIMRDPDATTKANLHWINRTILEMSNNVKSNDNLRQKEAFASLQSVISRLTDVLVVLNQLLK